MSGLFSYPANAAYDRKLPKQALYQHAHAGQALRAAFVADVDRIHWHYKLASDTINLPARDGINEIQIFGIELKHGKLNETVLRAIDQAANFPLWFELSYQQQIQPVAAYRQVDSHEHGGGERKHIIGRYFYGDWQASTQARQALPQALDLSGLYQAMLRSLIPVPARTGEDLHKQIQRLEKIDRLNAAIRSTEARLRREHQFNRKVGINAELRGLKSQLTGLTAL